jgi:hypothetical protein
MPTSSRRTAAVSEFSRGRWASEPPFEPPLHPTELDLLRTARPSRIKRALLALAGFMIATGTGAAATLVWQASGDTARRTIAQSSPQLGWLAPQVAPAEPGAPFAAPRDQLGAISHSAAEPGQARLRYRQIAAGEAGRTRPRYPCQQASAPPPAAVVPGRKPLSPAPQQQPAR